MIKTIYQFGEQLQKIGSMKRYYQAYGSAYSDRSENEQVIVVDIKKGELENISLQAYRKTWNDKYLFRELASARSTSILPTLHFYNLPIGDKPETFAKNKKDLDNSIDKFLDKLNRCLESEPKVYNTFFNTSLLIEQLRPRFEDFVIEKCSEKKNYLFTLKIDDCWLGEIEEMRRILDVAAYDKYFRSKGQDYKAANKICAVTYKPVSEVWGRVDTLGFTVNDLPFSRNGFEPKNSYKMFPVSPDAVKILEGTQRALEDSLSFGFQNLKFFVLPRFIAVDDLHLREEIVEAFVQNKKNNQTGTTGQINSIFNSEDIFNRIIEEEKLSQNSIYYDIFFYEQKQAQFSIKIHLSDVLPSRFNLILKQKEIIETYYEPITKVTTKKGEVYQFSLTLFEIKKFLPEPFFFQIMEAIFYKNPIKSNQVLSAFMQIIVSAFKNQQDEAYKFPQTVKRTFAIYQYFQSLELFGKMDETEKKPLNLVAEDFVEQHQNFFQNKPLSEAAFFLGCATEILLNAQEGHLKSRPFTHKLNNLSIGYRDMMDIMPKLLAKTDEYHKADKLYGEYESFIQLAAKFDKAFAKGAEKSCNKVETSYAFSLGLIIQREFFLERKKERSALKKERESNQ